MIGHKLMSMLYILTAYFFICLLAIVEAYRRSLMPAWSVILASAVVALLMFSGLDSIFKLAEEIEKLLQRRMYDED